MRAEEEYGFTHLLEKYSLCLLTDRHCSRGFENIVSKADEPPPTTTSPLNSNKPLYKDGQIVKTHMKRCSTLLNIRKMSIKSIMSYLTSTRTSKNI